MVDATTNSSIDKLIDTSTPNPAVAILFFFIITAIYCIISIFMSTGSAVQKVVMRACYILCIIIGEYFINLNLSFSMCGVYQWQAILFITIVPWLLIFGVLQLFLTMFPGWLSPFSNTFGYLVAKLMGLPDLMKEIIAPKTNDTQQAIIGLLSDPSLLINQFSTEAVVDLPADANGKIEQIRETFDNAWKELQEASIIKKEFDDDKDKSVEKNKKNRDKLYKFVEMKYSIAEFVWNILAGTLVTSVSYNYIIGIGCQKSAQQMKQNHDAYQAAQKQKVLNNAKFQANQPNYVNK
jgi:hypothetical protein